MKYLDVLYHRVRSSSFLKGRNFWLLVLFAAYCVSVCIFAGIYYSLYMSDRGHYVFNSDVLRWQSKRVQESLSDQIHSAEDGLALLDELRAAAGGQHVFRFWNRGEPWIEITSTVGKFSIYAPTAASALMRAASKPLKIRLERQDGGINELNNGPVSLLPADSAAVTVIVERWIISIQRKLAELRRMDASARSADPDVWTFADFLYLSLMTQASSSYGDIIPNSTVVRLASMLQVTLSIVLVVFLVNVSWSRNTATG